LSFYSFSEFGIYRIIVKKINPAAYIINRCAVKKIQKEKRGIDNIRHNIPHAAANRGLLLKIKIAKIAKKNKSCIFISFNLK
jgi:hypothetical protein